MKTCFSALTLLFFFCFHAQAQNVEKILREYDLKQKNSAKEANAWLIAEYAKIKNDDIYKNDDFPAFAVRLSEAAKEHFTSWSDFLIFSQEVEAKLNNFHKNRPEGYELSLIQFIASLKFKEKIPVNALINQLPKLREAPPAFKNILSKYLFTIGESFFAEKKYDDAVSYYDEFTHTKTEKSDNSLLGIVFERLGYIYHDKGEYAKAEEAYANSEFYLLRCSECKEKLAALYNNWGLLYAHMHVYSKAENYYLKSGSIREEIYGKKSAEYNYFVNNMANFYRRTKQYDKAKIFILENLSFRSKHYGEKHPELLKGIGNAALFFKETKQYRIADSLYARLMNIYDKNPELENLDAEIFTMNYGDLMTETERYAEAEEKFMKVYKIWKERLGVYHPFFIYPVYYLTNLHASQKNWAKAEIFAKEMTDILNFRFTQNASFLSETELSEFVKGVVSAINMIKYVYAAQPGKTAELLEAETLFKGRVLQNVKQIRDADFLKIPENKSLFDSMIFYRELAAKAVSLDEVSRKEKNIDLTKTLQSAENFEKQLVKKSSGFARRSQVNRFKTSDLQSKLKAGEVWIQIIRYHDYALRTLTDSSDKNQKIYLHNSIDEEQPVYAALLVFPGKQKPALVKIPSDGLETKYLNYYRNMINFDKEDSLSYQNYFGALEKLLFSQNQPIRKIYFCGDGVYNLININALRIPKRKKYLGEIFDIRLKTSPFAYSESNANRVEEANFYAVSDFKSKVNTGNDALSENRNRLPDLPGTIDEAQKASEAVEKMNLKPLQRLQSEANEKNIKSAKSPRVLHIATHGHFQPDLKQTQNNLMNAGLYLALDSANNGFLSAFEAANLALDGNELTFLSACETGLGQTFAMGEGVYGLQRAFKIAGAKYLIMSLWRVNDKITAEFAAEFYNEWSKTKNIEISFKNAQNKIKQKYKSPRFWAGFVLVE